MGSAIKTADIPIGRVELFGLVLHIVEHDGRLVAAYANDEGRVAAALSETGVSGRSCRRLMRSAVDLLLDAAETALSEPAPLVASALRRANRDQLTHLRAANCAKGMNRRTTSIFPG